VVSVFAIAVLFPQWRGNRDLAAEWREELSVRRCLALTIRSLLPRRVLIRMPALPREHNQAIICWRNRYHAERRFDISIRLTASTSNSKHLSPGLGVRRPRPAARPGGAPRVRTTAARRPWRSRRPAPPGWSSGSRPSCAGRAIQQCQLVWAVKQWRSLRTRSAIPAGPPRDPRRKTSPVASWPSLPPRPRDQQVADAHRVLVSAAASVASRSRPTSLSNSSRPTPSPAARSSPPTPRSEASQFGHAAGPRAYA
jgi:hypothetical protein